LEIQKKRERVIEEFCHPTQLGRRREKRGSDQLLGEKQIRNRPPEGDHERRWDKGTLYDMVYNFVQQEGGGEKFREE